MKHVQVIVKGFPEKLRYRAKIQAAKERATLKAIIIRALEEYLERVGG